MGATMVYGPIARPLSSTIPMAALRIFEKGVSRIRRRRCSKRKPRRKQKMPAQSPMTHQNSTEAGDDDRRNAAQRANGRVRGAGGRDRLRALMRIAKREMRAQQKRMDWAYVSNGDCARYRTSGHGRLSSDV